MPKKKAVCLNKTSMKQELSGLNFDSKENRALLNQYHDEVYWGLKAWIRERRGKTGWRARRIFYIKVAEYKNRFGAYPPLPVLPAILDRAIKIRRDVKKTS